MKRFFHFDSVTSRLFVVALLIALAWIPLWPLRVVAALVFLGFLPGATLFSRTRPDNGGALALAVSTSPVLFGAPVMIMLLAGLGAPAAARASAVLWGMAFIWRGVATHPWQDAERRVLRASAGLGVVAAVLAFALPLADTWWRVREDSWYHAAVLEHVWRHGLPASDPYFSPLRLQYMYFYHVLLASVRALSGVGAFYAMILLNAVALGAFVLAFNHLASYFSERVVPRVLALACALFSLNGLFYLFYSIRIARALVGDSSGGAALAAFFPWSPVGLDSAHALLSVEGGQVFLLDKFMLGTAFSLALPLVCVVLAFLVAAGRNQWSRSCGVGFFVALAGLLYLHAAAGAVAFVVTAAALAALLVVRRPAGAHGVPFARMLVFTLAAGALAAPYLYSVAPRGAGESHVGFAWQTGHAVGVLSGVLPVLLLALPLWTRRGGDRPPTTGVVASWAALAAAVALSVDLVTNNETKFTFAVFLPLAALAAGGIDRVWGSKRGRAGAIAVVVASTVPLHAIYYHHAVRDPSTFEVTTQERAVYKWIENETPDDALFVEEGDVVRIPVLAARDLYFGNETYARNWGYPLAEMAERRRVRDAIFSQGGASDEQLRSLLDMGRRVYVVYRVKPDDMIDAGERFRNDPRFRGRFATPAIAVYEILPSS